MMTVRRLVRSLWRLLGLVFTDGALRCEVATGAVRRPRLFDVLLVGIVALAAVASVWLIMGAM
jgi:hypothetical protein